MEYHVIKVIGLGPEKTILTNIVISMKVLQPESNYD